MAKSSLFLTNVNSQDFVFLHMAGSSQPQNFFAAGCIFADFGIALIFYPVKKTLCLCIGIGIILINIRFF